MRRATATTAVLLGSVLVGSAALADTATLGDPAARPLALVRVAECSRGPTAPDRHVTFRASMRRVRETHRMSMRFTLQERVGHDRFRTVRAPGLRVWRKSRPEVKRFSHRQHVLDLAEGSSYRAVVNFRWYDRDGELIRRATRRSRPCSEPGPLPNLSLVRLGGGTPIAGKPQSAIYTLRAVNRGPAGSPRFGVSFAVDGAAVNSKVVPALAPGESRPLSFTGPVCAASISAHADPEDAVREVSERDNVLSAPCPFGR